MIDGETLAAVAADAELDGVADACSHQLGEADAIISGYLDLLRARGPADADALRAIEGGTRRTRRVLQDLLELARTGHGAPVLTPVTLRAAVDDAVGALQADASSLDVRVAADATVAVDVEQLRCVLRQLLRAAAASAAPDQRRVAVTVAGTPADAGRVDVRVDDDARGSSGIGDGQVRGRGPLVGAGVARPMLRRMAERHGGRAVLSWTPAGGVVRFDLPAGS